MRTKGGMAMSFFQRIQDSLGWGEGNQYDYVYDASQDADYDTNYGSSGYDMNYDEGSAPSRPAAPPQAAPNVPPSPIAAPTMPTHPANTNIVAMPGLGLKHVEFVVLEPESFEDMPRAIAALRERKAVILNLDRMDPDQAQRAVDYVAGGTFAIDGDQERLGETIFLFTPSFVHINRAGSGSTNTHPPHNPATVHSQTGHQPRPTSSSVPPFVPNPAAGYPYPYSQQQY